MSEPALPAGLICGSGKNKMAITVTPGKLQFCDKNENMECFCFPLGKNVTRWGMGMFLIWLNLALLSSFPFPTSLVYNLWYQSPFVPFCLYCHCSCHHFCASGVRTLTLSSDSNADVFTLSDVTCKTKAQADLVLLVDGSWSIGRLNFRTIRAFIARMVGVFDIGPDRVQVGRSKRN